MSNPTAVHDVCADTNWMDYDTYEEWHNAHYDYIYERLGTEDVDELLEEWWESVA